METSSNFLIFIINPLDPDAHYSERQDKPFSLQIQQLEVHLKLIRRFLFFALGTNGLILSYGRRMLYRILVIIYLRCLSSKLACLNVLKWAISVLSRYLLRRVS